MKQVIRANITVEFDDKFLQADVSEAIADALKALTPMLTFVPAVKGKSKKGTIISFKIKEIEQTVEATLAKRVLD